MIKIYMHDSKWRMGIESEVLQFDSREEMEIALGNLIELKETNGKLNDKDRWDKWDAYIVINANCIQRKVELAIKIMDFWEQKEQIAGKKIKKGRNI